MRKLQSPNLIYILPCSYPFQYLLNRILFNMNINSKTKFRTMLSRFVGVLIIWFFWYWCWICLHTVLIDTIRTAVNTKPMNIQPVWKLFTTVWKSSTSSSSFEIPGQTFWNNQNYYQFILFLGAQATLGASNSLILCHQGRRYYIS